MRISRTLVLGSVAALLLAGCATATGAADPAEGDLPAGVSLNAEGGYVLERNEPVSGGTLRVALDATVDTLDPMFLPHASWIITRAIYDPLVKFDKSAQEVVGELAESLETDDDGKTWTMELKRGVKFHDGTDFNSAAVAAHFTRLGAESSTSSAARDARNFEKIETPDDHTLLLTLRTANPLLPTLLTTSLLTIVPSPTAVQALGRDFGTKPVGTGPFMIESFLPGSDARVVRNPNYHEKGLPYLDALEFVTAVDNQSRLSAAQAGDLDLAMTNSALDLRKASESGLLALPQVAYNYFNIVFNMAKPPFDDVRFREAVIQAINLDALNDAVYDGLHEPMTGIFQKSNPFYTETDWPTFDPDSAKKLIKEWQADTGNTPEFTLVSFAPTDFQKMSAIAQQMLADVGITMNIEVGEQATMISEAFAGNYTSQFRWVNLPPEINQALFNSFHSDSTLNIGHVGDPEIDKLIDEAKLLSDPDDRRKVYEKMQERFAEWLPMVPTLKQAFGWYAGDRVGGFPGNMPGIAVPETKFLYIAK